MSVITALPFLRGEERKWFDAAREQRLLYQQCADCGAIPSYPRAICPACWSPTLDEKSSRGRGTVYSFTVQYRPGAPAFAEDVPYTLVLVDLEEGFRMLADLRGADPETVAIGLPVEIFFDQIDAETVLPRFRPSIGTEA